MNRSRLAVCLGAITVALSFALPLMAASPPTQHTRAQLIRLYGQPVYALNAGKPSTKMSTDGVLKTELKPLTGPNHEAPVRGQMQTMMWRCRVHNQWRVAIGDAFSDRWWITIPCTGESR